MNIWQELPTHFTVLAPMEGVTDIVFRQVIAKAGRPNLFYTEFTNVSSFASEKGRESALERLRVAESDHPIIAQIWGKNPDHFAILARELKTLGFQGLDLNMGCPDRHVNKAGGGAAMIKTPDLAIKCIVQAKSNTPLPVSVKTRLGFTYPDEYKTWLPLLLEQNLAALTVHLRTRKEMSKVPAHYELIPEILKLRSKIAPDTRLIINGNIKDLSHAKELWAQYPEIDGVMIGRGVFENPFCFTKEVCQNLVPQTVSELQRNPRDIASLTTARGNSSISEKLDSNKLFQRKLELFKYHLALFDQYTPTPFDPLKHFFKVYLNNFPGASDLRTKLMLCKSTSEVRKVLSTELPSLDF